MKRSSFNVLFFLKKTKLLKNGDDLPLAEVNGELVRTFEFYLKE